MLRVFLVFEGFIVIVIILLYVDLFAAQNVASKHSPLRQVRTPLAHVMP
jgi:capsule polysaccharide export protein KpsE/RkpR